MSPVLEHQLVTHSKLDSLCQIVSRNYRSDFETQCNNLVIKQKQTEYAVISIKQIALSELEVISSFWSCYILFEKLITVVQKNSNTTWQKFYSYSKQDKKGYILHILSQEKK